jgi:dipeptidyl aminopeptidase/acylaminoacyl peptidase
VKEQQHEGGEKMMQLVRVVLVLAVVLSSGLSQAAEMHPFSVRDLVAMDRVSNLQVSPDGEYAAFEISAVDLDANKRRSTIWVMESGGKDLRCVVPLPKGGANPVWALDSRTLYFLSSRSGSSQIWRIGIAGGDPQQVSSLPLDVGNLRISPDGSHLAFSLEVFVKCSTIECTVKQLEKQKNQPSSGILYTRIFVRHWNVWEDKLRSHLFVMPAVGGAEPVDVSAGMDADIPSKPFGGIEEFAFTPDGGGMMFTAHIAGKSEPWTTNFDLYVAPIDGTVSPVNITAENKAWDCAPAFSPDGKTVAYRAMKVPRYESDRFRVVVRTWESSYEGGVFKWAIGEPNWITEAWDRSAQTTTWSLDSKTIYVHAPNTGQASLFAVDAATGTPTTLVEEGTVSGEAVSKDRVLLVKEDLRQPAEVYSIAAQGGDLRRLTHINDKKLAKILRGTAEQFSFVGAGGDRVYGYVMRPVDFNPQNKYPVTFLIHGGPQSTFGNMFNYRWNPQIFAGAGYASVMIDYHGSLGYGQQFTDSITGDWGGKPLEDLQEGLAVALDKYPWMDGQRVAALGPSYGGFMIHWIAGKWAKRFTCLVNHAGTINTSAAYSEDELWFIEHDLEGTPWSNPEGYQKFNPANFVGNWETPMLLTHGAFDFRVPIENAVAAFNVLQRRNIPSQFLYFPDEGHWILKPQNSIKWYDTVISWVDRWTKHAGSGISISEESPAEMP